MRPIKGRARKSPYYSMQKRNMGQYENGRLSYYGYFIDHLGSLINQNGSKNEPEDIMYEISYRIYNSGKITGVRL